MIAMKFALIEKVPSYAEKYSQYKDTIIDVMESHKSCYYANTAMCLEMICEKLYYEHKIDARYKGRSIYIGDDKIATVEVDREGYQLVGMYGYKLFI